MKPKKLTCVIVFLGALTGIVWHFLKPLKDFLDKLSSIPSDTLSLVVLVIFASATFITGLLWLYDKCRHMDPEVSRLQGEYDTA